MLLAALLALSAARLLRLSCASLLLWLLGLLPPAVHTAGCAAGVCAAAPAGAVARAAAAADAMRSARSFASEPLLARYATCKRQQHGG
jgi:hypothetical protein